MPRMVLRSWIFLIVMLVFILAGAVQAEPQTDESAASDSAEEVLVRFQSVFVLPERFSGQVIVSVQGGAADPLGMELSGLLEVYDRDLYRFTYLSPQNVAGRRVVVSQGVGYAYWKDRPNSGDFIYYPEGVGYLMPFSRIIALLQNLSSLQVVSSSPGTWAGREVQVLKVVPDMDSDEGPQPQEAPPWTGTVWMDIKRAFPLRYELTGPNWKEIYEVGLVNRDDTGELVEFTLSGVGQPSGDQLVTVFSREGRGHWFPTFIRLTTESTTVEQKLTDIRWDLDFEQSELEIPQLRAMRDSLWKGQQARKAGDFAGLARSFEEVVRLDPYNVAAHLDLGYAYLMLGDDVKAEAHLQQALMLDSELAVAYNNLAYLYIERNTYIDKGVALAEKAVRLDEDNPAYLDTLGWGYYHQGRFLEAVRYLKRALEVGEKEMEPEALVEIYYHLALAYQKTDAKALAQKIVEKALALGLEDSGYTAKLKELAQELSQKR